MSDIDTGKAVVAGAGGITGLSLFWFWIRSLRRKDAKEETIDGGWTGLITSLNAEVIRLRAEVMALRQEVSSCAIERSQLVARVEAFERRYGTRREDTE